jgi:hypothetical protein
MLYKITWQHYLLCVAIALALWYGIVLWIYYREDAKRFLIKVNEKAGTDEGLANNDEPDEDLLGKPEEEYGVSIVDSQEISFGVKPAYQEKTGQLSNEDVLKGLIPDLMEEIKSIIYIVETEQGTKDNFISLFKLVSSKYSNIKDIRQLKALNEWISDNLPFELTQEEFLQLWE